MAIKEDRIENARKLHEKGYSCSQAVACSFSDKVDLSTEDLFRITEGLGLGGADTMGTCGAVSGMSVIMALLTSTGNLEAPASKANTMKAVRELNKIFRDQNGSTICRELKGMDTGKMLRSCPDCITDAVTILSDAID